MEVDHTSPLELGHPAEGEPDQLPGLGLRVPENGCQVPKQIDRGPAPQLGCTGIVEDSADVVVTLGTQWRTDELTCFVMVEEARPKPSVRTAGICRPGMARSARFDGMDGTEAWGGQGHEDCWVLRHLLAHAPAAHEARLHEVASVASVDRCTGRAPCLPATPAGLEGHAVGQRRGGESKPTTGAVVHRHSASHADRIPTPAAAVPLVLKGVELLGHDPPSDRADCLPIVSAELPGLCPWHAEVLSPRCTKRIGRISNERTPGRTNEYQRITACTKSTGFCNRIVMNLLESRSQGRLQASAEAIKSW